MEGTTRSDRGSDQSLGHYIDGNGIWHVLIAEGYVPLQELLRRSRREESHTSVQVTAGKGPNR